jgi:hypothetical protein
LSGAITHLLKSERLARWVLPAPGGLRRCEDRRFRISLLEAS